MQHEIQMYREKLAHLQADNMIYCDQIERLRRRLIQLEDYQIKYQLLLQREESQGRHRSSLRRSRRMDEINNMEDRIAQNNEKCAEQMRRQDDKHQAEIESLNKQKRELSRKLENAEAKLLRIKIQDKNYSFDKHGQEQRSASELESIGSVLQVKLKQALFNNSVIQEELQRVKNEAKNREFQMQSNLDRQVAEAKQFEKQCYRETILKLQNDIKQLQDEVEFHKQRASPERQNEISRLNNKIKNTIRQNTAEIESILQKLKQKDNEYQKLEDYIKKYKSQTSEQIQRLTDELSKASSRVFNAQKQTHFELIACRQQMNKIREKEILLLKEQFENIQKSFETQRIQWKSMIDDMERQLERIKDMWEEEKQKYLDEKNKLKEKIKQLKNRVMKNQEEEKAIADGETFKLIQSLKKIDLYEDKYNDYQNGITFLHRQLKRATAKIQEQSSEISHLLQQQQSQRAQFSQQVESIKKIERNQASFFQNKLILTDEKCSKLLEEVRQKDRQIRENQQEHKQVYSRFERENLALKNIIEEMERDYKRVTETKKEIYKSYRSERDNAFSGKAQLNQERKKKWLEIGRQKSELEIAYKERQRQIRDTYDIKIKDLQDRLNNEKYQNGINVQQLQNCKQKLSQIKASPAEPKDRKEQIKQFNKKVAALDLQVSLTQNLYQALKRVKNNNESKSRKKTTEHNYNFVSQEAESQSAQQSMSSSKRKQLQLQEMGLEQDDFVSDNVVPTFSAGPSGKSQPNNRQFTFPAQAMGLSFNPQNNFGSPIAQQGSQISGDYCFVEGEQDQDDDQLM